MKKFLPILVIMAMIFAVMPGVMAVRPVMTPGITEQGPHDVTTDVIINHGTGYAPWIKCKWEATSDAWIEDDLTADGIQVDPVLGGDKTVYYWAVVTDYEGLAGIEHVYVEVFHPDGEFKYQFELINQLNLADSLSWFEQTYANNPTIMEFSQIDPYLTGPATYEEIVDEILQEEALVWWGQADLNYCQPAGEYRVETTAVDVNNLWAVPLINYFWYVPTIGVEYDFTNVNYGAVDIGVEGQCGGDIDMMTPAEPTVRNIGNVPVDFNITQDDMGLGMTGPDWNVHYAARLGNAVGGTKVYYDPFVTADIIDTLPLCTTEKFDFFILVDKAPLDIYSGSMTLYAFMNGDPAIAPYITPTQFIGP
jgi:hypothetical protein